MFSTYDAELIVLSILVKSALIAFEGGDPRRPRYGKLRGFFMKIVIPTNRGKGCACAVAYRLNPGNLEHACCELARTLAGFLYWLALRAAFSKLTSFQGLRLRTKLRLGSAPSMSTAVCGSVNWPRGVGMRMPSLVPDHGA